VKARCNNLQSLLRCVSFPPSLTLLRLLFAAAATTTAAAAAAAAAAVLLYCIVIVCVACARSLGAGAYCAGAAGTLVRLNLLLSDGTARTWRQ
jgi:hypothetical protein